MQALIIAMALANQAATPVAAFFDHPDKWTKAVGAEAALREAGFRTQDYADAGLSGADVLVLGSFSTEDPRYQELVASKAAELRQFVQDGGVIVQFTQADQTEAAPPFLPSGMEAKRADPDYVELFILKDHPLFEGLSNTVVHHDRLWLPNAFEKPVNWEGFTAQKGMSVLMSSDPDGEYPAILEGQLGKGRILLLSLALDKRKVDGQPAVPEPTLAASKKLFENLREYVAMVRAGAAPAVEPTPPFVPKPVEPFVPGSWTIAVLPDTQMYSETFPHIFEAQTKWVAENRDKLNIVYCVQLGDITNRNTREQWEVAKRSMDHLNGKVPYAITLGNHDMGPGGNAATRETFFNEYFPKGEYGKYMNLGGTLDPANLDNAYYTFTGGGRKWIVLALEFGPRDAAVEWANRVVEEHPDHEAILITHAHMYFDDERYYWGRRKDQMWTPYHYGVAKLPGGVNDGEDLWKKLVSKHKNFRLVLNGHVLSDGLGKLTSKSPLGHTVHEMLVNYQMKSQGGEGFLRLLEFQPDGTISVRAYSPFLDKFKTDSQNQFKLKYIRP